MADVDFRKVRQVVAEVSEGSAHAREQERKDRAADERAQRLSEKWRNLGPMEIAGAREAVRKRIQHAEQQRRLDRVRFHIDLDAFFAACEHLDKPSLKEVPMAVGTKKMLTTANYEARKYGVRSATPGFVGLRLCPHLTIVDPDMAKYERKAEEARSVMAEFDPDFRPGSLDEAYLDVTDECTRRGISGDSLAVELRERMKARTGLTCSVGVGPNKRLAKVASDMRKPDGQFQAPSDRDAIVEFMDSLPIRTVSGIGRVSERILSHLGISTCGDIRASLPELSLLLSERSLNFFLATCLGLGDELEPEREEGVAGRKGMSQERTFQPTNDSGTFNDVIEELCDKLVAGLENESLRARSLTLKMKAASFEVHTRQMQLPSPTRDKGNLLRSAQRLMHQSHMRRNGEMLRLIGIRLSHFQPDFVQPEETQRTLQEMLPRRSACTNSDAGEEGEKGEDEDDLLGRDEDEDEGKEEEGDGLDGESLEACDRCGKRVRSSDMQEHADWHLAREMQRTESRLGVLPKCSWGAGSSGTLSAQKGGRKRARHSHHKDGGHPKKVSTAGATIEALWRRQLGQE